MAPNFEAVVFYCKFVVKFAGVCHICAFFVEEVVPLLGEMIDKLVLTFVCGRNWNISIDLVKVSAKIEGTKFFACELWVERTFGVVLYCNQ